MGTVSKREPIRVFLPGQEKPIEIYRWTVKYRAGRWQERDIELRGTVYAFPEQPGDPA